MEHATGGNEMTNPHPSRRSHVLAAALVALALAAGAAAAATPQWTLTTDASIGFQRLTPLGTLLVGTDAMLGCVDPATGQWLWKREDLKKFKECNYDEIANTPYGLLDLGAGGSQRRVEVVDLATGQKKWDSEPLPMNSSQGLFQAPEKRMLVLFGLPKKGNKPVTVGVDTETGEMKWQQDRLFEKPLRLFEVKGSGKVFKRFSVDGNQPPVCDGNAMIVWITADGPTRIDLDSGAKVWVCDALKGKEPAALADGYCGMLLADGVVYVPYEKSLQALDAATGKLLWAKEKDFKGRVVQLQMTPHGLVVRGAPTLNDKGKLNGKAYIDVLDPKTGLSVWAKPFKDLDDATTFEIRDGRIYIAADGELHEIGLADGAARSIAKFKFKEHEVPTSLELRGDGFLLSSDQTLLLLDANGGQKYLSYFEAPSYSGWMKLGVGLLTATMNAASYAAAQSQANATGMSQTYYLSGNPTLGKRFRATTQAEDFSYILTTVTGDGKKGPGLVKVGKATGQSVAELRLGDKTPEYVTDPIESRVFFLKSDKTIEGYSM
jgi:outer membrane protein assembly factor BamB